MKKNIIVLTRCRNESRQLNDFLNMCGEISDGVLFLDDHSIDGSLDIAKSHKSTLRAWSSYSKSDQHIEESTNWIELLTMAEPYQPEWVLLLDIDERLDVVQFNNHYEKLKKLDANMINFMWPFYNEITNKAIYWGWGPNENKNQFKIKFKKNIFLKFKDITPICKNKIINKPSCRKLKQIYTNIVLKHNCIRPAKERLEKWARRLPVENELHLGYPKEELIQYVDCLKKIDPNTPTTDKWLDSMEQEHGTEFSINRSDLIASYNPTTEMLIKHVPDLMYLKNKELLC